MPGRKEQIGAAMEAEIEVFMNSFFVRVISLSFEIFCSGSLGGESFSEMINVEAPKSPVRRGSIGSFIGRFKVVKPRKPAKRNIVKERRNFSSLKMIYEERKIKRKGRKEEIAL